MMYFVISVCLFVIRSFMYLFCLGYYPYDDPDLLNTGPPVQQEGLRGCTENGRGPCKGAGISYEG